MKKYTVNFAILLFASLSFAQVAIEKATVSSNEVLLEFNDERAINNTSGQAKGIILPVSDATNVDTEGTLWVDASGVVQVQKNGSTFPLTAAGSATLPAANDTGSGSIIEDGTDMAAAKGVLVLKSTERAMILPHVNDATTIPNPEVGLWVYDSGKKAMAFFNGTQWEFNYGS